ncbi:hypothetical protein AcV7_001704 [Taiwanofungus camphoratus]|nr:hypothetical protein AcV7_001704 [Antrodia cinnamomea]
MIPTTLLAVVSLAVCVFAGEGISRGEPASYSPAIPRDATQGTSINRTANLNIIENSGVCETTPGVYQASGYANIATQFSVGSMWFWFFEARNNPDTAPFTLWINGGPGCSSMVGLFQEHGPCRITNDSTGVTPNNNSWNEVSNMLYVDQPIGVGWSYGISNVTTTQQAAVDMWEFLQTFFADSRFSKYQWREFAFWTESYGGHYGPVFAAYFLRQNAAVADGSISDVPLNFKYFGIGDGLTDPLSQYASFITYAASNPYYPLVPSSTLSSVNATWSEPGGCKDQITACYTNGTDAVCAPAQNASNTQILQALSGIYDPFYILSPTPDAYPPNLSPYLCNPALMAQIGALPNWTKINEVVTQNMASTGDMVRNSRPDLETVIDAGVRTVIYVGDADYLSNYMGVEAMLDMLQTQLSSEYAAQEFSNWTVAGQSAGIYRNAGTLSYVRVFGAGHEVPAYQYGNLSRGEAALQIFKQILNDEPVFST